MINQMFCITNKVDQDINPVVQLWAEYNWNYILYHKSFGTHIHILVRNAFV